MTVLIIVVTATVLISAMCSLFEATLYSTRVGALEAEASGGRHSAKAVRMLEMKRKIAQPTSAILILNTVANTAGAAVAGMLAANALGENSVPLFSLVLTFLILFFAEIVPKTYGATGWRSVWPWIVAPLHLMRRALAPAVFLTQKLADLLAKDGGAAQITEDEVRAVIRLGGKEGEISRSELKLLDAVFHFDDVTTRQIMLPRGEVVFFDADASLQDCLEIAARERHTRFPLCEGSLDSIIGLVHVKDLLGFSPDQPFDLRTISRPLRTVPDTLPINRLLRQMQTMRMHMAAVADEYGSVVGFITMDNVVEQLIGAVRDEFDDDEIEIVPEEEGVYKIRGALPLDRVNRELGLDLESESADSVSGLVTEKLGRLLNTGDQAEVPGASLEVLESQAGRAVWLRMRLKED